MIDDSLTKRYIVQCMPSGRNDLSLLVSPFEREGEKVIYHGSSQVATLYSLSLYFLLSKSKCGRVTEIFYHALIASVQLIDLRDVNDCLYLMLVQSHQQQPDASFGLARPR